jgi:UDP-glucose 4-epimerase
MLLMNIAVFGANGYIGRHLVHYITLIKSQTVTCFDIQEAFNGDESVEYVQIDIADRCQIARCGRFDQIYFFSGLSGTAVSFQNYTEFIRVNEIGLLNILDHYKDALCKPKIIFPSTRLVYKGVEGKPLAEQAEKECKTIYASSKLVGEGYLKMYRNIYELDYTIFRIGVPYGKVVDGRLSYGTVGFFLERATNGSPIVLFGDGGVRRTFTHVMDVCRQVVETAAFVESSGECFNIDGETHSLADVAELIANRYGVQVRRTKWPALDLRLESGDTIFDSSKIRMVFPQTLTFSLERWLWE